jgi:hypothetical protein
MEPALLFHASFGIAVANSIVFLGATLKDRKLMTLRQWLLLQLVVLVSVWCVVYRQPSTGLASDILNPSSLTFLLDHSCRRPPS